MKWGQDEKSFLFIKITYYLIFLAILARKNLLRVFLLFQKPTINNDEEIGTLSSVNPVSGQPLSVVRVWSFFLQDADFLHFRYPAIFFVLSKRTKCCVYVKFMYWVTDACYFSMIMMVCRRYFFVFLRWSYKIPVILSCNAYLARIDRNGGNKVLYRGIVLKLIFYRIEIWSCFKGQNIWSFLVQFCNQPLDSYHTESAPATYFKCLGACSA